MEWSNSLLRHFKIQTLLKINCCMTAISAFRVTQHSQIFSLFFRNRIQCIALYQLHNSQAVLSLSRGNFIMPESQHFETNCRICIYWISEKCILSNVAEKMVLSQGIQEGQRIFEKKSSPQYSGRLIMC